MILKGSRWKAGLLSGALAGAAISGCQENDVRIIWLEAGVPLQDATTDTANADSSSDAPLKDAGDGDSSKDSEPQDASSDALPDAGPDALQDAMPDGPADSSPDSPQDADPDAQDAEAAADPCAVCAPSRRTNAIMAKYSTDQGYPEVTERILIREGDAFTLELDGTERDYIVSVNAQQRLQLDSTDGIVRIILSDEGDVATTPSQIIKGGNASQIKLMVPFFSTYDGGGNVVEGHERDHGEDIHSQGSAELVFTITTATSQSVKKAILHEGEGYDVAQGADSITVQIHKITEEGVFASFDWSFEGAQSSSGPIYTKEGLSQLYGHHDPEGAWLGLWTELRVSSDILNGGCRAISYTLTDGYDEYEAVPGLPLVIADAEAGTHTMDILRHAPDETGSGKEAISVKVDGVFRGVLDLEWDSAIDVGGKELRLKGQSPIQDICGKDGGTALLDEQSKGRYASVRDLLRSRIRDMHEGKSRQARRLHTPGS